MACSHLSSEWGISLPHSIQSSGQGLGWRALSDSQLGFRVRLHPICWLGCVLANVPVRPAVHAAAPVAVSVWILVSVVAAAGTPLALHPALCLHAVRPLGRRCPIWQSLLFLPLSCSGAVLLHLLMLSLAPTQSCSWCLSPTVRCPFGNHYTSALGCTAIHSCRAIASLHAVRVYLACWPSCQ